MRPYLAGVLGEKRLASGLVRSFERLEVGVERRLGIDDHVLAARQPHDDIRPDAAVVAVQRTIQRLLFFEVAVFEHAGELDHPFQLDLAPTPTDTGPLERIDQAARLGLEMLTGQIERGETFGQRGAALDPAALGTLDFAVDLVERLLKRAEQMLDGLLARIDIAGRLGADRLQPRLCQLEKRPVVRLKGFGAERLKGAPQRTLGVLVGAETLRMNRAISFD